MNIIDKINKLLYEGIKNKQWIKLLSDSPYRSNPLINKGYDMYRIVLTLPEEKLKEFKRLLPKGKIILTSRYTSKIIKGSPVDLIRVKMDVPLTDWKKFKKMYNIDLW